MTKFEIGDRVKVVENFQGLRKGAIHTVTASLSGWVGFGSSLLTQWLNTRFELYAKAGEFVKGDVVMTVHPVGGPWTVLDVQARDDGQRICFPGEYGQWWRAEAYRLATSKEIAGAELATKDGKPPSAQGIFPGAEIPAADFDFSTIKAGDEIVIRYKVDEDGVSPHGLVSAGPGHYPTAHIHSIIPAPKPKTLRERAIKAVRDSSPMGHSLNIEAIVDLVLAEVERGQ